VLGRGELPPATNPAESGADDEDSTGAVSFLGTADGGHSLTGVTFATMPSVSKIFATSYGIPTSSVASPKILYHLDSVLETVEYIPTHSVLLEQADSASVNEEYSVDSAGRWTLNQVFVFLDKVTGSP
jgi:hypothetical protein